jgi:ElaB/YqjD/DUF883 family membrane-anchored ribosome-binding protein
MASAFSRFRGDVEDDLEAQIARLTRDLSSLKKTLARRGSHAYDDARDTASDLYDDVRHRVADALPVVRRQAKAAEQAAREHPATAAVVGLVVVGLLATLFARR